MMSAQQYYIKINKIMSTVIYIKNYDDEQISHQSDSADLQPDRADLPQQR